MFNNTSPLTCWPPEPVTGERGEGPRGCGPGPLHFSGKGDLGPGFFWADGDGGLGRTPTENWDPIPGGRDASDHSLPTPSRNPPLLKSQYHVWPLGCMSKAIGTGPGVPTHGHQHVPLEGVRKLPPNEHLQAEGCTSACQEPRSPSASLSTRLAGEPPGPRLSAHSTGQAPSI